MPLPKIDVITHSIVVPSTKEEIRIRPFLVKEQKILLTVMTGQDAVEISDAVKQVVNNCIVTPNFNVDKLEIFDLEYIMLQLRIVSVGESIKLNLCGDENSDCEECKKERQIELNLREVQVDFSRKKDPKIQITDSIGLIMKYPTHKAVANFSKKLSEKSDTASIEFIIYCIDSVYDSESVTSMKDVTLEEAIEFIESLTTDQFNKIEEFLDGMPKLSHEIKTTCKTCKKKDVQKLEGLESFLA